LLRMRLKCSYKVNVTPDPSCKDGLLPPPKQDFHLLNEVVLNRGRDPSLISVDIFVNGDYLTSTLVSTPLVLVFFFFLEQICNCGSSRHL